MGDNIIRLPKDLVLKIAAGEVVERPSSVVKELVENSIDAGSTAITVEIQDGGIKFIRVLDNGIGIKENMLGLAFERHSTSKISSDKDLFSIQTLGFRGEALASISAVSTLILSTKHKDNPSGVTVTNTGGVIESIKPSSINIGTSIIVKNLFFNTPARLKFLKKPSVEASYVNDLIMRLILSHPDISFRYINNGKLIYHSIGDGNLSSAIARVYDVNTAKKMYEVNFSEGGLILKGYIGVLELEKNNRSNQSFFVNGRFFKDSIMSNALEDGTHGYFTISKFPMCVLNLIVPFDFVDVNVHPNKLEVRFSDNEKVYNFVKKAVESAVTNVNIINKIDEFNINENTDTKKIYETEIIDKLSEKSYFTANDIVPSYNISSDNSFNNLKINDSGASLLNYDLWQTNENKSDIPEDNKNKVLEQQSFTDNGKSILDSINIIGTIFDTFIVVQTKDLVLMIDQHAAQERINYDRLMNAYKNNNLSQSLISPLLIELNSQEAEIIRNLQNDLYEMGFDVSFFDESSIAVRAVPMVLGEPMSIKACFKEIFSQFLNKPLNLTSDIVKQNIAQTACKHSIKAGKRLSVHEISGLLNDMFTNEIAPTCPHGRPIIIKFTKNDLYKMFKRIQ